jgi:flagellar motility protein MotE (MotC chaperone)
MIRIFQSPWIALALGVLSYAGTTWFALKPQKLIESRRAAMAAAQEAREPLRPSWEFKNAELDQMLAEIKDEREALKLRAQQLTEWETRLQAERQEIYAATQVVARLQADLDQSLNRVKDEETANLKKLAKMYGAMAPENAARILREMGDDQVVKILATMKESESAVIIENIGKDSTNDAKHAAIISNRLRLTLRPGTMDKAKPQ